MQILILQKTAAISILPNGVKPTIIDKFGLVPNEKEER